LKAAFLFFGNTNYEFVWQKFEKVYQEQLQRAEPSVKAQFDYSWCLVRSPYKRDLHQGIALLEGTTAKFDL